MISLILRSSMFFFSLSILVANQICRGAVTFQISARISREQDEGEGDAQRAVIIEVLAVGRERQPRRENVWFKIEMSASKTGVAVAAVTAFCAGVFLWFRQGNRGEAKPKEGVSSDDVKPKEKKEIKREKKEMKEAEKRLKKRLKGLKK